MYSIVTTLLSFILRRYFWCLVWSAKAAFGGLPVTPQTLKQNCGCIWETSRSVMEHGRRDICVWHSAWMLGKQLCKGGWGICDFFFFVKTFPKKWNCIFAVREMLPTKRVLIVICCNTHTHTRDMHPRKYFTIFPVTDVQKIRYPVFACKDSYNQVDHFSGQCSI